MTPYKKWNHLFVKFFSMLNVVLARVDYFQDNVIETKLDIVSVDDKNLQRRRKVVGQRDFPI